MADGNAIAQGLAIWQVKKVTSYMRDHLSEDIGLDELAAQIGLGRFRFCTAFRLATGRSPYEVLVELRMRRACELLAEPARAITDIAFDVGYETPSGFAASFRKFAGVSPTLYRRDLLSRHHDQMEAAICSSPPPSAVRSGFPKRRADAP